MNKKEEIFLKLVEENKGILYKVSNAYCKNPEDRKDLIQEIIIQIWGSFNGYNSKYKISTWIYRVSLNTAISYYRKNKVRKENTYELSNAIQLKMETPIESVSDPRTTILYRFIGELKPIDKAIILLYLDGLSQKQIAEIVGISSTNAGSKISRIKKVLKRKFDKINNYE